MSFVYQHRKKDTRYSPETRREWWVCITNPGMPKTRYRVGSKAEAIAEMRRQDESVKAVKYNLVLGDKPITDVLNEYLSRKVFSQPSHMRDVCGYVAEPYQGVTYGELTRDLYEIKRTEWRRHRGHREEPLAPNTVRAYEKFFRAAINSFDANSIFVRQRIRFVPVPNGGRRGITISDDQFALVVGMIQDQDVRDFLTILRYTGIRNGTLLLLPWRSVNFISQTIRVPSPAGKERTRTYDIYIDGRIFELLVRRKRCRKLRVSEMAARLLSSRPARLRRLDEHQRRTLVEEAETCLFPNTAIEGKRCFYNRCRQEFLAACRRLPRKDGRKAPVFHMHDLRATCATEWYLRTRDIVKVSHGLGHASIRMTMNYLGIQAVDSDYLFQPVQNNPYRAMEDTSESLQTPGEDAIAA